MNETIQPAPIHSQGLVKSFKGRSVLDGIDLDVPAGSVVGLLGKNGSGKTTFIKCLLGLLRADGGEARILGEDSWSLGAAGKARLGYVPQIVTLYPWMRVEQVMDYTAPFYPHWNGNLVDDLLRRFELDPSARIKTLSLGTLQKVAIIMALGHEPELLVLDEPAASLDPVARRQFLTAILEIAADSHRTVLFSTHITSDLERVADRVAILRGGRIVYDGELDELKDSVKRLHVSAASQLPSILDVPGCIDLRTEGSEALLTVRGPWSAAVEQIQRSYGATVKVEDLNLEDIFLEIDHEPQSAAYSR